MCPRPKPAAPSIANSAAHSGISTAAFSPAKNPHAIKLTNSQTVDEKLSEKARVLKRLCDAFVNQERVAWPPGSLNRLPVGELPLPMFRGAEWGGDSANVRLNELRMPEERSKGRCGIPIKKAVHFYEFDGKRRRVVTYRIAFNNPASVHRYIDIPNCRLDRDRIEQDGGVVWEYDDDAGGMDKPGKAVIVITKAQAERERLKREQRQPAIHPLAPQLST